VDPHHPRAVDRRHPRAVDPIPLRMTTEISLGPLRAVKKKTIAWNVSSEERDPAKEVDLEAKERDPD
jgi:hypothetical protein